MCDPFITLNNAVSIIGFSAPNSCKHILESGTSVEDGEYSIRPMNGGESLKVYCDMTTDGGKITRDNYMAE